MKKIANLAPLLALVFSVSLSAQNNIEIQHFEMTIAGTSSLHDWESSVTELNVQGHFTMNKDQERIESLQVEVPVLGVKSTKGSIMDKKTWKALNSENHPLIIYNLNKVESLEKIDNGTKITATGQLTIAGSSKTINMIVNARKLSGDSMELTGSKALKMTDFNIKPPKALMGTLKTGNDITIGFRLILKVMAYN